MIERRDAAVTTFLRSVPVFHDLKGNSLELLFDFLEERTWAVGERIFNEGDLGRTMYVIREGEVEVARKSARGKEVGFVHLGPGECFGEMTLVELQPRSAACVVRKKCTTYSLTNLDLWNLYKADNYAYVIILQNICRMLSRRLRKADSRIVDFIDASSPSGKKAKSKSKRAAKRK
ncbi:MAG: cyclic nucleotide-binding domain-containing protein [Archangium sp.]|nr:cyclic nucleotide-binding domain-containing protein [Archangium sp.]